MCCNSQVLDNETMELDAGKKLFKRASETTVVES